MLEDVSRPDGKFGGSHLQAPGGLASAKYSREHEILMIRQKEVIPSFQPFGTAVNMPETNCTCLSLAF